MSAAVRQVLAGAASTVVGVACSPYYRQSTKAGDAFVRLDTLNRDETGFGYMVTWQVCVLLPQGQADAERWIDTHSTGLLDALASEGAVTTAQPVSLALESGTVPALVITLIREKD